MTDVLDNDEDTVELAMYEVVETEDGYALEIRTVCDMEPVEAAGHALVKAAGKRLSELVGLEVTVSGRDVDGEGRGFISANSHVPEDHDGVDEALVNTIVNAMMVKLIKGLLPSAQIEMTQPSAGKQYLN